MRKLALLALLSLFASMSLVACHAADDDADGLAGELSDPVRRQHAISKLHGIYATLLRENEGNREAPPLVEYNNVVAERLAASYTENPLDTQNGIAALRLMIEMQDARALPAYIAALDWRIEVTEDHAVEAAGALRTLEIPDGQKAEVVRALGAGLAKVNGTRSVDNRLRISMIRALGAIGGSDVTPILTNIATTQSESQPFLINFLAATELGKLGDASAIPELVKCLFIFDPTSVRNRMNSVAAEALVRIGRDSLEPLLALLRGENSDAEAIVTAYIAAVRGQFPDVAAGLNVRQEMSKEASFALGELGFREALEPLLAETEADDPTRRQSAATALVRLNHEAGDIPRIQEAIERVFNSLADADQAVQRQAQVLAAMQRLYDPGSLEFFKRIYEDRDVSGPLRLEAATGFVRIANKSELEGFSAWLARQPEGERLSFEHAIGPRIEVANECDEDIACYRGKLGEQVRQGENAQEERARRMFVIEKAAFMISRLGRGDAESLTTLIELLGDNDINIRMLALRTIDRIATGGSPEAVARIGELVERGEGTSIGNRFKIEALPTQARLATRH